MKILLVEDELLIQRSLKKMLEKRGAEVIAAASGKEAIQLIREHQFDRVVCDLMLQDITGFDVLEESRSHLSSEQLRHNFVIITAYTSAHVLDKAESYGCTIISKPFEDMDHVLRVFMGEQS